MMTDTPNDKQAPEEQGGSAANETQVVEGRPSWVAPAVACGIAAFVLLFLLLPGILIFPGLNASSADNDSTMLDIQQANNKGLEDEIAELKKALKFGVCTRDGNFYPQTPIDTGQLGQPGRPGQSGQAAQPLQPIDAVPPSPRSLQPDSDAIASGVEFSGSMLEFVDQATVLIGTDTGSGTGFWVAPGKVLTNSHVVNSANEIYVASKAFPSALPAERLAATPLTGQIVPEADFAILNVADAPSSIVPLSFTPARQGQNVMVIGFPGYLLADELSDYFAGRSSEAPTPASTEGTISLLKEKNGVKYMPHTATTGPGNSGGPVVDYCGRAVAIHTFGREANPTGIAFKSNYALSGLSAVDYLETNGVTPRLVNDACDPRASNSPPDQEPDSDEPSDGSEGDNAEETEE